MKHARRIFSLLLVLSMLFALVACGGGGGKTGQQTPGTTPSVNNPSNPEHFVMPDRPVDETKGKTYTIIQHSAELDPFGYKENSLFATHAMERLAEVQETYGCELKFSTIPYGDDYATQIQSLVYANNAGDIVFSHNQAQLRKTLGTGGDTSYMQDLLALNHIINFWDMEKWGDITARETMMAGGTFYGVAPALWINYTPLPYYQLVYNKDLIKQFECDDPQELWEQKAWDRDAMLDIITSCYDDTGADPIWGMTATLTHMMRATYLTTGMPTVIIESINADETVNWSRGLDSVDAKEALSWLQDALNNNAQYFNNGQDNWETWASHEPLIAGQSTFALTRPSALFDSIVVEMENFGLSVWGGADANVMSGYYENSSAVAIPIFAQNATHSAFLMADIFEGLGENQTQQDVIDYYLNNYFDTELDVQFLLRTGANNLQYSYWPNGGGDVWPQMATAFLTGNVATLIQKNGNIIDKCITEHMVPNQVQIEKYRQNGYFN